MTTLTRAVERRPAIVIGVLLLFYILIVQIPVRRPLWHDELFTYYISQAPTFGQLLYQVRHADLNPPLSYLATRASMAAFGDGLIATRLPSMIGYLMASGALLWFVSRRAGVLWGAACVALFWSSPFFLYATEARPYALLLMFFGITLVSWDYAVSGSWRRTGLAGVVCGSAGLAACHAFGPLSVMPFCAAELVRWYRARRFDPALWICLLAPVSIMVIDLPMIRSFQAGAFPEQFQGGMRKLWEFYSKALYGVAPALAIAMLAAPLFCRRGDNDREEARFGIEDAVLFGALMLLPVLLNILTMRSHGAFWDRYCITTACAMYAGVILCFAWQVRFHRAAALVVTVILLVTAGSQNNVPGVFRRLFSRLRPQALTAQTAAPEGIYSVEPELPFVAASGLTFLEMDHRENAAFVSRLYYVTDRESAVRYAHATIFEGFGALKMYFPIRANVMSYAEFIARHQRFLAYGTIDYPEDWLLRKVLAEGAELRYAGTYDLGYKDRTLYEVTMPQADIR